MLSLLTLVVLALASYRGTQLIVHDSILDPARARFELWHARKHDSKIRTFFRDLLGCTYCTGWWVSGATLAAYLTVFDCWHHSSLLVHALEWFAVAGAQSLLNRWDDTRSHSH